MNLFYSIKDLKGKRIDYSTLYFLLISVIFFMLNRAVPFYSDDYEWVHSLPTNSLLDAIVTRFKTIDFTPTTCGRLTCHLAVQFLLTFGELWFDLINSIMLFCAMQLTKKVCFARHANSSIACLFVVLAFLYFPPNSETLFYWGSGSANYLFPLLLTLLFFIGLMHCDKLNSFLYTLFCIIAFSTGWSHEIFSLPIACAIIAYSLIQRHFISKQQFFLCVAFLLGATCLVLSPGSLDRLSGQESMHDSVFNVICTHVVQGFKMFRDGKWIYVVLPLTLWIYIKRYDGRNFLRINLFFFLCLFGSFCMIALLGHGGRAIWGIEVFSFILLFRFIDRYINNNSKKVKLLSRLICFCLLIHLLMLIKPYYESWGTYRIAEIESKKSNNLYTIPIDDWHSANPLIDCFVAHPYQLMMHDVWMRIPQCHSFCRRDIYEKLKKNELANGQAEKFGDVLISPKTTKLVEGIKEGSIKYNLAPISFGSKGGCLMKTWHVIMQRIMPNRYPVQVPVTSPDIMILKINNKEYVLFNQPLCPIFRDVESIAYCI